MKSSVQRGLMYIYSGPNIYQMLLSSLSRVVLSAIFQCTFQRIPRVIIMTYTNYHGVATTKILVTISHIIVIHGSIDAACRQRRKMTPINKCITNTMLYAFTGIEYNRCTGIYKYIVFNQKPYKTSA